ncbi:hypothetical protein CT409_22410 [Salmonella enterica]|nr:hypothetical protein [Salmonella enterica]EHF4692782.1 hypothetical protein [Salmonella enterica subsp. enterica serovar Muenchen]
MKKTLIALVLATASVSGSAMADGGVIQLGGILTPQLNPVEWQVSVGESKQDLNANVREGATEVNIPVQSPISVLGIGLKTKELFYGREGISPQIDYHGALAGFKNSEAPLTLKVKNSDGSEIGTLSAPLLAGAEISLSSPIHHGVPPMLIARRFGVIASQKGDAFFGGLPVNNDSYSSDAVARVIAINPKFNSNYNTQGAKLLSDSTTEAFKIHTNRYSAFYGSGIEAGKSISIKLNKPMAADNLKWTASLPITVTYI